MNIKSEQQSKTKKRINTIKVVSVFLIIGFIFIWLWFAQDAWQEKVDNLAKIAHFIISFLSRWWALFAILAGKLMSNDLIYWWFMHLDIFLWKIRNIMKNFANYTLWLFFLYMIIKSIISNDWWSDLIKKKLVWFVLAWILIQASRFIIWALVDISTISVTAVWAIPWQILQSDLWLQTKLVYMNAWWWANNPSTWEIMTWLVMTFDPNKKLTNNELWITTEQRALEKPITQNNYIDMILPSYNTISWPLIFFGTSIFKFQDFSFSNPQTTTSRKRLMEFALNLLIIVVYSIAMIALVIINFFRIFFLWIVIMFSPFIILFAVFSDKSIGIIDKSKMDILKNISIWSIMNLIFKPVIFMLYISLMMIFVIGVRSILIPMNWGEIKLNEEITINSKEVKKNSYNSSIKSDWLFNFTINWAKNSLAELIVYFVTLFLLWTLIKIAIWKWESWWLMSPIEKKLHAMTKQVEKIAWQVPIVPIWWSTVWVNSVFGNNSNSLINRAQSSMSNRMWKENMEKIREKFWNYTMTWSELSTIAKNTKNPEAFWTASQSFASDNWGISYNWNSEWSKAWTTAMGEWFEANKTTNPDWWERKNNLNDFLNDSDNLEQIHTKMWWKGRITKINELEQQQYWK